MRYTIQAGELGESGVVTTMRQLLNRVKEYDGCTNIIVTAKEETKVFTGKLTGDKAAVNHIEYEDKTGIEVS